MKLKLFYLFCLIIPFVSSCEEDTDRPNDIIGRWDWISSTGGIASVTYTPESTGDKVELEFTLDSIYREYRNDTLIYECKFGIVQLESSYDNEILKKVIFEIPIFQQFYELESPDKLVLIDNGSDGFVRTYLRIK